MEPIGLPVHRFAADFFSTRALTAALLIHDGQVIGKLDALRRKETSDQINVARKRKDTPIADPQFAR